MNDEIKNIPIGLYFEDVVIPDIMNRINFNISDTIIINTIIINNIIDLIKESVPIHTVKHGSGLHNEMYILYVISYFLNQINSKIEMSDSEFLDKIYYPNLIYIIANNFQRASLFFKKIIRRVYNNARLNLEKSLLFYITFYNSEFIVIKNDVISIFLNNMIFDINPLEIDDYESYYETVFNYIFKLYLEQRSAGIIDQDIQITSGRNTSLSSRFNIFKNGIRLTQIQSMCCESSTLKHIYRNFNLVKCNIISNELQKLYSVLIDGNAISNNKSLILKFNSEDEKLVELSNKFPLIYKMLRSVKVKSETPVYSHYDKMMIREVLRDSIFLKLQSHLNEIHASILADAISIKLEENITEGDYLDPYTLTVLEIKGSLFLKQLSEFINLILDHIETIDENSFNV